MNTFQHELDGNDLIAYHLRELSARQQRSVRRMLEQNAALAAESEAIAATLRAFPRHEAALPVDAATRERTWLALLPSLAVHPPKPPSSLTLLRRWSLPLLAGSAFAATLLFVSQYRHRQPQPSGNATTSTTIATGNPPSGAARILQPSSAAPSSATLAPNATLSPFTPNASALHHARPTLFASMQPETSQAPLNVPATEPFTTPTPAEPSASTNTVASATAPSSSLPSTTAPHSFPSATALPQPVQPAESTSHGSSSALHHTQTSPGSAHPNRQTDIALSVFGAFSNSTIPGNDDFYRMNPAASAGGLFEVRHIDKPYLGWEASYSFRRANEIYDELVFPPGGCDIACPIPTYAVSATSQVFTADWLTSGKIGRFKPFVLLGAGLLLTRPGGGQSGAATATQAAFDYGAGVDWGLTRRIGLRLQYRGDLYKAPGITPPDNTSPNIGFMHTSEPVIGVYYRF